LGDFDSFEYAINLKNFIDNNPDKNLDIFAIAIGTQNGKEKFCNFTGFRKENLIMGLNLLQDFTLAHFNIGLTRKKLFQYL